MIGKELMGKRPVTIPEVYELLKDIKEPTYEQKATREYAEKVKKTDGKKARELVEKLKEIVPEELAVKIVNIMPKDSIDVHVLLSKEEGVTPDLYEKILEILK